METKICSKCGGVFPATNEYFRKSKSRGKYYLRNYCIICEKEYNKKYEETKERKEYNKKYREENKAELDKYFAEYRRDNAEKRATYNKKWLEENKEKHKEYNKIYAANNRSRSNENMRNLRSKNKGHYLENGKIYYAQNKTRLREYFKGKSQERRAKLSKLPSTLTLAQWELIKQHFNNRCAYCGEEKPLEQEHFIPLTKGGEYTHNNIIPACKLCNGSKWAHSFFEWYPRQLFYSKEREKAILTYLGYKNGIQQLALM